MVTRFLILCLFTLCASGRAAEVLWNESFDGSGQDRFKNDVIQIPGRGGVLHFKVSAGTPNSGHTVALPLPIERIRGQRIFFGADVKASAISHKPNAWNGVKVMLVIQDPSGTSYPQTEITEGSSDWQRYASRVAVPKDATNVTLVLGLEQVTGEAWFDNASVILKAGFHSTRKVDPSSAIFRGHALPRLRGAMAGTSLNEEDVKHFGTEWKGNLLRLQLFEAAQKDRPLEDYDAWLDSQLQHIDEVLGWCEKYGVAAVFTQLSGYFGHFGSS